ncbi:hypothetical protein RKD30_004261 [Streptomyces pristinaespiralis]
MRGSGHQTRPRPFSMAPDGARRPGLVALAAGGVLFVAARRRRSVQRARGTPGKGPVDVMSAGPFRSAPVTGKHRRRARGRGVAPRPGEGRRRPAAKGRAGRGRSFGDVVARRRDVLVSRRSGTGRDEGRVRPSEPDAAGAGRPRSRPLGVTGLLSPADRSRALVRGPTTYLQYVTRTSGATRGFFEAAPGWHGQRDQRRPAGRVTRRTGEDAPERRYAGVPGPVRSGPGTAPASSSRSTCPAGPARPCSAPAPPSRAPGSPGGRPRRSGRPG